MCESGELVAIEFGNKIKIPAIRERVLSDYHVAFAVAGVVEQFGNPTSVVGPAHIDLAGLKRIQNGMAIIEQLLRGPEMGLLGRTVSVQYRRPEQVQFRGMLRVFVLAGPLGQLVPLGF